MAWVDWYSATRISASISTTPSKTCGGQASEVWPRRPDSCRLAASRVRDGGVILESMIIHSFANSMSFRDALMRGFRIYDHTEKVGEAHKGGVSAEAPLAYVGEGLRQPRI